MDSNNLIEGLLQKPLWQMTGEEYCQLTQYAMSLSQNAATSPAPMGQKALGVRTQGPERESQSRKQGQGSQGRGAKGERGKGRGRTENEKRED